jgi:hypothetical protein
MSIYVFGYGSLINKNELIKEFSKKKKVIPAIVSGLKRAFNVSSKGGAYKVLGVKDSKQAWCNGVLIKVNEAELLALIKRESHYVAKIIKKDRFSFPYGKKIEWKREDRIVCFYPEPLFKLNKMQSKRIPVRPNYLNICLEGAAELGEDFLQGFRPLTTATK